MPTMTSESIQKIASGFGLQFNGNIERFNNGTLMAQLQRVVNDETYQVILMRIPEIETIEAYAVLVKNQVVVESNFISARHVFIAMASAVATFATLKAQAEKSTFLSQEACF